MFKITIDNEEVLCDKDFTINEEMLNTSSVILNNVYPRSWELDKDYVSRFYYPKDYSKCKIFNETIYPTEPGITQVGTNITTSDVDLTKMNTIALEGQSYQTTTNQSINLLDVSTAEKGYYYYTNGTGTSQNWYIQQVPVQPNTSYYLSGNNYNNTTARIVLLDSNKNYISVVGTYKATHLIETTSTTAYIGVSIADYSGSGDMGTIMLEKGSSASPYVPYVESTPNPDKPQPINITTGRQVVSVCGKNYFNKNNVNVLNAYFTASTTTITSNAVNRTIYVPCKPNTTYVISRRKGSFFLCGYTKETPNINVQVYGIPTTTPSIDTNYFYQVVSTVEDAKYLVSRITNVNSDTITLQEIYDSLQIEEGSTPTTYEEYIGNDYEINLGKNLINQVETNKYASSTGTIQSGNTSYLGIDDYVSCQPNTTYSITFEHDSSSALLYVSYKDSEGNFISRTSYSTNRTFTTPNNAYTLFFYLYKASTFTTINGYVQLEKGSVATSYSPYKEPMYLYGIGNYRDCFFENVENSPYYDSNLQGGWYLRRIIGTKLLNGSGNWATAIVGNMKITTTYLTNSSLKVEEITSMCEYFKSVENTSSNFPLESGENNTICLSTRYNNIYIRHDNINDIQSYFQSNPTNLYYVLETPSYEPIDDKDILDVLQEIKLISGVNNITITSPYLPLIANINYNYVQGYTEENMLFCGVVENTGNISLNPRYPHYCNLQVLDFKTFLSEGETLDFVIYKKTIEEAIDQVISVIAPYGFVKGNINILGGNDVIGAYSTKDKTAYDVFNYLADITQSRWTTRMIDENTIAIDFYDPSLMTQGTPIEYNQTWFCNNKILDMSFNYSSRDYRNKQVMLSGEVYSNISTTEIITADGYQTQFNTTDKIGYVSSILLNGNPATIITKEEYDLGYEGDFIYQPGNPYFESEDLVSTGAIITIVYYAVIEGREVILNQTEINRVEGMTGRKGVIARYETRNDATTTTELNQIGQSYLKYKGSPEITLRVQSLSNIWNIGERVSFTAPLTELTTEYMVKKKSINYIATQENIFYTFELTSSFNSETDINYFDNQRAKTMGNIGVGEYISRNIDIENEANVIFYDLEVNEVEIDGVSTLQSELQSPLGVE